MTDHIRRLSTETRQALIKSMLSEMPRSTSSIEANLFDSFHDLDVADKEIAELRLERGLAIIEAQNRQADLVEAQATILKLEDTCGRLQSYIDNELCDIRLDNEAKSAEIAHLHQQYAKERAVWEGRNPRRGSPSNGPENPVVTGQPI